MSTEDNFYRKQKMLKELYRFVAEQVIAGLFKADIVDKLIDLGVDKLTAGELVDEMERRLKARQRKMVAVLAAGERPAALSKQLKVAGFQSAIWDGSGTVLKFIEKSVSDLLFVDYDFLGVDGYKTVKSIRAHPLGRKVPLVVVCQRQLMQDAWGSLGLTEVLEPEWDVDKVLDLVTRVLSVPKIHDWEAWQEGKDFSA